MRCKILKDNLCLQKAYNLRGKTDSYHQVNLCHIENRNEKFIWSCLGDKSLLVDIIRQGFMRDNEFALYLEKHVGFQQASVGQGMSTTDRKNSITHPEWQKDPASHVH
jgi:hypothetical protein